MAASQSLSSDADTFSSALSCGDWDLSDHSNSSEETDDFRSDSKTVTFGKVRVRSFPMILGDNPSCSRGLPVTLDWKSIGPCVEFDLNAIDSDDAPRRPVPRLSSKSRHAILLRMGVSQSDANKISKEITEIKRSRSLSSLDHRKGKAFVTNVQSMQNERLSSTQAGKQFGMKKLNMDDYLRGVACHRQKA